MRTTPRMMHSLPALRALDLARVASELNAAVSVAVPTAREIEDGFGWIASECESINMFGKGR